MARLASIDLGTNTFHLLIVDYESGIIEEVYRDRIYVSLAEDGIDFISEQIKQRIYNALGRYRIALDKFEVKRFLATGTAALRAASNGEEIIDYIFDNFQIPIQLISGDREAELIYKGTQIAYQFDERDYLIMDIGGGSTEFILVEHGVNTWYASYPVGISVLYNLFQDGDSLSSRSILAIHQFLDIKLATLKEAIAQKSIKYLVGASGSFDVIESVAKQRKVIDMCCLIDCRIEFQEFYEEVVYATVEEISRIEGVSATRVKLLPLALVFIDYVLKLTVPEGLLVSPYALKEGVLRELVEEFDNIKPYE